MQQLQFLFWARNKQLQFSNKTCSKKLQTTSLGLALVLLICLASPTSSCTEQEKNTLLQFLEGLSEDGGLAASWKDGTDCCTWEGIFCGAELTVERVLLPSMGLQGHILSHTPRVHLSCT
jgi:hypothetical protein